MKIYRSFGWIQCQTQGSHNSQTEGRHSSQTPHDPANITGANDQRTKHTGNSMVQYLIQANRISWAIYIWRKAAAFSDWHNF